MTMTAPAPGSVSIGGRVHALAGRRRLTVGSAADNDIVVSGPQVTAHHLAIDWQGAGWVLLRLDAQAHLVVDGRDVGEYPVISAVTAYLGDPGNAPALVIVLAGAQSAAPGGPGTSATAYPESGPAPAGPVGDPDAVPLTGSVTIGRTDFNDVVVDDPLVSRSHARITRRTGGLVIEDLASVNGTFVDGARVGQCVLHDGAVVTVGNTDFTVSGNALLRGDGHRGDDGLQVRGVGLTVDGGRELLRDIEFTARPGTLTAVIGPSGAGKSTLSTIIAGLSAPTTGQVTFDGRDVHADYEVMRTRIGMVPQSDVVHGKLTLRQALRFAAEIRLPADLSTVDRDRVIASVLDELGLSAHLDTRIDTLSGGQRKRASVAMELLTGPSLLILDEPTSGLDPALDRQVMAALRRLAYAGRVVIVVTHSLAYLNLCDQVLLLAPGGKTAYRGRPAHVPEAMGTADWAQIFAHVAAHPDEAHDAHRRRSAREPRLRPIACSTATPLVSAPRPGARRQAGTVARRQLRLILADTGYLAFLAIMPIVLGLLTLVIPGSSGFGLGSDPDTAGEAVQLLVVLTIGAVFMGTAVTVRDLVGERDVYERERAVGLRPAAYLSAKVAVFSAVATLQTLVMVTIAYLGKGLPSGGVFGAAPIELILAVAALACVSTLVGLAISATVRSAEQTMPPLVIVVIAQLVFCGGLFRLTAPVIAQLSWLFPSYWGYAGAAMSTDLRANAPLAPQTKDMGLWDPTVADAVLATSALMLIATALITYIASRLRLPR
ncbi:MAG: ATP-binding cassette domain-containing protein [Gordonia sp. (in: high G+C Gram-positive bacteria)]|uniref:ATP-binding cassette domain-containing protein n=1 Tax=Gordonia sp. (in: high G+C Gram-positive bacteria) TaxID=84139 RepID=UPI0039E21852